MTVLYESRPAPASHRLRLGRHSQTATIYSVTACCQHRQPYLAGLRAGRVVVSAMRACDPGCDTLCYVVMPDHVHWLLHLKEGARLGRQVQRMKGISSAGLGMAGKLWQRGFHDRALRSEDDLRAIARYIVCNPLRAGIVKRIGDYPLWDAVWL